MFSKIVVPQLWLKSLENTYETVEFSELNFKLIWFFMILERVYTSIFTPAWVDFGVLRKLCNHVDTEVKAHAAVFSRPSFRPNWNFTSAILRVNKKLFHSGLKFNFFMQIWHHRKLYRLEISSFVKHEDPRILGLWTQVLDTGI